METPRLHVLVVEDDRDNAESMSRLLTMWDYIVEVAFTGEAAFAAIQASCPDAILLDLAIPGMDGWTIAEKVRTDFSEKRVLLIAISGYADAAARDRSQQAGVDLHLAKPVDPEELRMILQNWAQGTSVLR